MKRTVLLAMLGVACLAPPRANPAAVELLVDGRTRSFTEPRVLSIDDANEHWQLTLRTKRLDDGPRLLELHLDDRPFCSSSSWGSSGDDSWLVFALPTPQAMAVASALGTEARARQPLPVRLSSRIDPDTGITANAANQPLRIVLTNAGPEAVWFLDGGRGRNELGRDNRFTFEVILGDTALPIRHVMDFGGIGQYRRLGPGEAHTFVVDLAHWCRLERPGAYSLRVHYEAELMPDGYEPHAQLPLGWHAHLQRIRQVTSTTNLVVR